MPPIPSGSRAFEREAQLLASLNHPHIGAIYGFEDSTGMHALVLELVEGDTLADRIAQGPIPVDEALPIARQIAEALEAAHESGIIHRDLKPANIKITPDGTSRCSTSDSRKPSVDRRRAVWTLSHAPTMTATRFREGIIIGTRRLHEPGAGAGPDGRQAH